MRHSWTIWRARAVELTQDIGLLGLRLWLAQEFIQAGWIKWSGGPHAPEWFASLPFPWPVAWLPADANWLIAGSGEVLLGGLMLMGLASRFSAIGLLFITYVAVYSVHFDLGWAGWNQIDTDAGQGFKVPLMLALMLLTILTQGGGRYALDAHLFRSTPSPRHALTP
jgi:putative oxidoreductase